MAIRGIVPLLALAVLLLAVGTAALSRSEPVPAGAVRVRLDEIPPDACFALFGPGPCRPHGAAPTTGWTDAVAGPPPQDWHGKVK